MSVRGLISIHFGMVKRTTQRLRAVAVVLALVLLATHAVSDWHIHSHDEDHCQICHVGHAAIPQAAAEVAVEAAAPVARLALAEGSAPKIGFVGTLSISRAPSSLRAFSQNK